MPLGKKEQEHLRHHSTKVQVDTDNKLGKNGYCVFLSLTKGQLIALRNALSERANVSPVAADVSASLNNALARDNIHIDD